MTNEKYSMSNQCQSSNFKIWHQNIGNSIGIWHLTFVIKSSENAPFSALTSALLK